MATLNGTCGLITGIANKRSIAWAIAKAMARDGARLALTYQGERLLDNVQELAAELDRPAAAAVRRHLRRSRSRRCSRRSSGSSAGSTSCCTATAFAPREELSRPFVETSREGFRIALDVSAYSLIALSRGAAPADGRRAAAAAIVTLTYLGSDRVFPNYNVMGVAKAALEASVRYLADDLGPQNIRVNAISAGPIKTLAASGISGFGGILQVYRDRSPLRRNTELEEVGETGRFLLGPESSGITGEVLMVDSGYHVMGI